jgi:dipeptidyl aminopeptidase/acylaminoacyl peptidase
MAGGGANVLFFSSPMLTKPVVSWKTHWIAVSLLLLLACSTALVPRTVTESALGALGEEATARFFYPSAGSRAEAYLVRPRGAGPFPLIIFLHGHSAYGLGAIRLLPAAELFAREVCYAGLAISLPGYGGTEVGGGPLAETTRSVVLDAIAQAKKLPWIDAERLYIYGFSRGAVVATALVHQIEGLKGAMLHSGAYDLTKLYQDTSSFWLRQLLNPGGEEQPRFHDLLSEMSGWRFSTLVLHGRRDSLVPFSQALLLRDRLASLGKPHRLVAFPEHGHRLPVRDVKEQAVRFLIETGGTACATNDP